MGVDNRKECEPISGKRIFSQHTLLFSLLAIATVNAVTLYTLGKTQCNCTNHAGFSRPTIEDGTPGAAATGKLLFQGSNTTDPYEEVLVRYEREVADLKAELKTLNQGTNRLILDRTQAIWDELMARPLSCASGGAAGALASSDWIQGVQNRDFQRFVGPSKLPMGWSITLQRDSIISPVGHGCAKMTADLEQFMNYKVGDECPDDETLTQKLLVGGCEPLPKRRCFAKIPENFSPPYPLPESLWTPPSDGGVIWTAHTCKNFSCLRSRVKDRVFADCLDCFDLEGKESSRWVVSAADLDFTADDVLAYGNGTIRIGLDLGGGTGTFAVRMKERGVTIVTTTLNLNGPFNNFIAMRGVVPLYITVSERLPFFDNTLDIVHSMHVLSNWIPNDMLEFLLYDIDRVLRPGGLFWLDHFFCVKSQLATYVPMLDNLNYAKLKWHVGDKVDRGKDLQEVYISALLMKPTKRFSSQ